MIEKFSSSKHSDLIKNQPFKYESCEAYLDFAGYVIEQNGEKIIATQDLLYPNDFPYLYLPNIRENWHHSLTQWVNKEQFDKLKKVVKIDRSFIVGSEHFYKTSDFIELEGSKWSRFRKDLHYFKENYNYKLLSDYSLPKVKEFLKSIWLPNQQQKTISFEENYEFFLFCLENQERYDIKVLYVEIDGVLAGLNMGCSFNGSPDNWIALHIKVDYKYRGISRFLYHERAKLFANSGEFTSGAACAGDEGVEQFKQCLNPVRTEEFSYVVTGENIK